MAKARKKARQHTFIRAWRKHRGLNQEQLAKRVGVSQETISRLERGTIAYTQPTLEAVADVLRCKPADLITRDPSDPATIWSIWDQIPASERPTALKMLEGLAAKASGGGL